MKHALKILLLPIFVAAVLAISPVAVADKGDERHQEHFVPYPLKHASVHGNTEEVRRLLDDGANPNAEYSGPPALMLAAHGGHAGVAKVLLSAGADVNAVYLGGTALMAAAAQGHAEVAKILLSAEAHLEIVDSSGRTALMSAAQGGHAEVVDALLSAGANPNVADFVGMTPLHFAIGREIDTNLNVLVRKKHDTKIVAMLLSAKAYPNKKSRFDFYGTPLVKALACKCHDIMALLLLSGADANAVDKNGKTALFHAVENNDPVAVALLTLPIELDVFDDNPGLQDVLADINLRRSNLEAEDEKGRTALILAVLNDNLDIIHILLSQKSRPDKRLGDGSAAIHYAVGHENNDVVKKILAHGGSPNIVLKWEGDYYEADKPGLFTGELTVRQRYTPLDLAEEFGNIDIQIALKDAGGVSWEQYNIMTNLERSKALAEKNKELVGHYNAIVQDTAKSVTEFGKAATVLFGTAAKGLDLGKRVVGDDNQGNGEIDDQIAKQKKKNELLKLQKEAAELEAAIQKANEAENAGKTDANSGAIPANGGRKPQ